MKKLCVIVVLSIFTFTSIQAQGVFNGGIHIGLPVGEISDYAGVNLGLDVSYLVEVADSFQAGLATGYTHFTSEFEGFGFIPLVGTAQYDFSDQIFGGIDLGYAVSTNGGTGGFYYQPKVGYRCNTIDTFAFYKGISANGGTVASFGVGAAYRFN